MKKETNIEEIKDVAFGDGTRAVWMGILGQAMRELGMTGQSVQSLSYERAGIVSALRDICDSFGDNDWTESDHLKDVIENHLRKHLEENLARFEAIKVIVKKICGIQLLERLDEEMDELLNELCELAEVEND